MALEIPAPSPINGLWVKRAKCRLKREQPVQSCRIGLDSEIDSDPNPKDGLRAKGKVPRGGGGRAVVREVNGDLYDC
jgi:hypothetical protein